MAKVKKIEVSDVETGGATIKLNGKAFDFNATQLRQLDHVVRRVLVNATSEDPSHEGTEIVLPDRL